VAPSANISGNTPPRDTKSILKDLEGNIDVIIDAGRTDIGVESTVVDMTVDPPQVLREGAVKREAIEKLTRDR
jgi:L-threonylcarbamoyladenylate synthase